MNKKFTFMVAALLAAGSFSANAEELVNASADKYYHIYVENTSGGGDNKLSKDENLLGLTYTVGNGSIVYTNLAKGGDGGAFPSKAQNDSYLWKIKVQEPTTDTYYVTLTNKATGKELAVDPTTGALVDNISDYDSPNLITVFNLDKSTGKLTFGFGSGTTKGLKVDTNTLSVDASESASALQIMEAENTTTKVADLKKMGTGVAFDLEGTIDGEDLLSNVSVVTIAASKGGDLDATSGEQFLLQVGSAEVTEYDLSSDDGNTLDKFKAAEFIVLTSDERVDADATEGLGLTYKKVKGENIIKAASEKDVTSGKYPFENALFTAIENANTAGKYAIKHASVYVAVEQGDGTYDWTEVDDANVYLGYGGSLDDLKLTSSDKIAWGKFSLGTAVDVKTLVTGKYVVNILVSANKETSEMRSVIYSKQAAASDGKATPVISGSTESTDFYKDAVHAQWVVSANADNTVTFINRETNAKIENVTLFKTPKANVYTTSSVALTDDKTSPASINLNSVFVELRKVDNTTQWDGFLKLDEEGLNTEYTLSVDNSTTFEEIEANLIADDENSKIIMTNDATVPALTFKLAQSKSEVGLNETKLDTLMVNPIVFKYYKDGELTEVKDTLKAIKYNFVSLVNTGKKVVKADFGLADNTGTSGKFVFRKNGDRYQIANNKGYEDYTFVQYDKTNKIFELTSTTGDDSGITDAASFSLNPVAVAPSYDVPESHIALQINGAYLGSKADGNAIMTNDTSMLKSTVADAAFSFWAFSADKEEAKTPSYYLSSNGMMMYSPANEIAALEKEMAALSPVFDAEERAELKAKIDAYKVNGENLVKFQRAKYEAADKVALADTTYTKDDDLKPFKFNVLDVDGQAVLKNAANGYVKAINDVVVFTSDIDDAAKFDVVAAEAPTSNESVSASEVKVIANNGSIVVKNAAGKNVVVSTILGQVVANEVLTSDNATINVPAGIVVVAVEGESFKVNVK